MLQKLQNILQTIRHTNTKWGGKKMADLMLFLIEIYRRPLITREFNWEKYAVFFTKWTDDHTQEIFMFLTVIQCSDI